MTHFYNTGRASRLMLSMSFIFFFERANRMYLNKLFLFLILSAAVSGCGEEEEEEREEEEEEGSKPSDERQDSAKKIAISLDGSLQNPAWSPDGEALVFTRFYNGYNVEPADLVVVEMEDGSTRVLINDGSANVNLPGAAWNAATEEIVFSSSREPHDEIYVIDDNGVTGDEMQITGRDDQMAYEPSFSPDGEWVVFESHAVDQEDNGVITRYRLDGTGDYETLTDTDDDCRQPNWAPEGGYIVYQCQVDGRWDLWVMKEDGSEPRQLTTGPGDKTDASFSPNGKWIVYSSDAGGLELANIFIVSIDGGDPVRVTHWDGYDGSPSWASTHQIAFESYFGDPDDSPGTTLWVIDVPDAILID